MPKKSIWDSQIWKIVVAIGIILGIVSSALQISGTVDFWTPLNNFLMSSISLYLVLLAIVVILILIYLGMRMKRHKKCVLDWQDARNIAILCQTPRTTEFLRQKYDYWQSQKSYVGVGHTFNNYMKQLEKQDYLKYQNGTWHVTEKALDYIAKYHGG